MVGRVGDSMVDVVVFSPPSNGHAANEVGNEYAGDGIGVEAVRNSNMPGIVS